MLSVIVTAVDSDDLLPACLADLFRQTLSRLQIIVVQGGGLETRRQLLGELAGSDTRVELVPAAKPGLGAARDAGVAVARAPYITFLDAGDSIPADAYQRLVSVLERTASDFVTGATVRDRNGRRTVPGWSRTTHTDQRLGTSIEEFPDALADLVLGSKVFRREFWLAQVGAFGNDHEFDDRVPPWYFNERIGPTEDGVAYLDHVPMLTAYLRAQSFDIVTPVTWFWRVREQVPGAAAAVGADRDLATRLDVIDAARHLVVAADSPSASAAWIGRVLTVELPILVQHALRADDLHRQTVSTAAAEFVGRADALALSHAPVDRKLLVALAAAGRWDEADDLLEAVRLDGALPATSIRDGQIVAALPYGDGLGLPRAFYLLSAGQSRLDAVLSGLSWDAQGTLTLDGWALIRGVDLNDAWPTLDVCVRELGGSRSVSVAAQSRPDPAATEWANDSQHRYDRAGFRVIIPAGTLPGPDAQPPRPNAKVRWQLWVRVVVDGVERCGPIGATTRFGTYDRLPAAPVLDGTAPNRIVCTFDQEHGLVLDVRADAVRAESLTVVDHEMLGGTLRMLPAMTSHPIEIGLFETQAISSVPTDATPEQETMSFQVSVPSSATAPSLRVRTADGQTHRVGWPADPLTPPMIRSDIDQPAWQRSPRGNVQVQMPRRRCQVLDVRVAADSITLTVSAEQLSASDLANARLTSAIVRVSPNDVRIGASDRWTIVFPLLAPSWPDDLRRSLPTGTYTVSVTAGGESVSVVAAPCLLERLPQQILTDRHAVTVARSARSTKLQIVLRAPLHQDERSRVDQRRLQRSYRQGGDDPADQVYFQCYRGEFATDSQRAIHDELRRLAAPLDLVWGVADTSVALPDGARRVVIGTREWYETLRRSRYLCSNVDFDRFLQLRPYQRFLQTFHGYPFKSMGVSYWRSKGLSERAVSYECDRRNSAWSAILVPAAFCADLYRENYRYIGEILVTGYPRDDGLAGRWPAVRAKVRRLLGIDPGQRVVLYAPTWRESNALTAWTARRFDELDVDRLTDALGPDVTILLRGHARTLRDSGLGRNRRAAVIDVTRYPEINDLIHASDVALMDYSSLRFDWMITGKPMLFFVPDLEDYLTTRIPLLDYAMTAPGPLLRTTDEVVDALRDLDRVSKGYARARSESNTYFNALNDGSAAKRVAAAFFDEADSIQGDSTCQH